MCCYCGWRGTWWGSWGTKGKNSWETALDQGFAYSSLLLKKGSLKTKGILQSPRYDCIRDAAECWQDRTSQCGRPRSLTTICWSDLIRCDGDFVVSVGQILPGLVREKGDSYYEVAPLVVRERNRKPHDLLCCKSSSNERQTFSGCAKEGSRCVCQSDEVWGSRLGWGRGQTVGESLDLLVITAPCDLPLPFWAWPQRFTPVVWGWYVSETLCTTSVAWLEDVCLCFQMQKSTSLSHHLIPCCLFPIVFFCSMFFQWQANWVKLESLMKVVTWDYCRFLLATWYFE